MVKKLAFDGKHKIQDKFEEEVYTVLEQSIHEIPVYKVKSDVSNKERTPHRNHLLIVDDHDDIELNQKKEETVLDENRRVLLMR